MNEPKCRMLVYGSNNIGDTIQAVAISRLLPQAVGVRRDGAEYDQRPDLPTVIQGFLYKPLRERLGDNCLFAGIYLCTETPIREFIPWLKVSPWPIGVRDPWTASRLIAAGIENVVMVGCPTLTLLKHTGPRRGSYAVDAPGPGEKISHVGWKATSAWVQWIRAIELLRKYQTAALVTTNRLHATLPCLAFGTPVKFVRRDIYEKGRLSLLAHLGVKDEEKTVVNLEEIARIYRSFLERHLGIEETINPKVPILAEAS